MAHLGDTKAVSLTLLDGVIGNLNPKVTTTYDLGTSSLKWNNIYGTLKGNADTATALTSNAGSGTQPIYFSGGKPVSTTYALGSTVNAGTAERMTYYSGANAISASAGISSDGKYINIGDTVRLSTSWGGTNRNTLVVGQSGVDKIVVGNLQSTIKGAVVGAHNSALSAWAPLHISGTAVYLYNEQTKRAQILDGCLSLFPANSSYREGLRIHSYGSWADILLCGNDNTGDSGTSANSWFIGNNNGNFYIARNGSSSSSSAILSCVSNVWSWNGTATGSISGNAATATQLASTGTTGQFWRGDNTWSNTLTRIYILQYKQYSQNKENKKYEL